MRYSLRFTLITVLSLCFSFSVSAFKHDDSNKETGPIRAGESYSNIYNQVWHAVLDEAGVKAEVLFLPHIRKRRMFVSGEIVIDCCAAPEWRTLPEEENVQIHTLPIVTVKERYVFKKGQSREISVEDFSSLRFSIVRGFSYQNDQFFGTVVEGNTKEDVLELVDAGRAEVTIMDEREFHLYMKNTKHKLELGGLHSTVTITARVHKSRPDLLIKINNAIRNLHDKGTIMSIIEAAHSGKSVPQVSR